MDTIYYNLSAKRVKVSGGADLLTFVTAPAQRPAASGGQVLDFDRCRQRLETKTAWRELVQTAETVEDAAEEPAEELPACRRERKQAPVWLDVVASLAVIAMALAATAAFLSLL